MPPTVSALRGYLVSPVGFHLFPFFFCVCVTVPLRRLCLSALDGSPAALKDLLNLIPAWQSSSVLAPTPQPPPHTHTPFPRFPGESQTGKSDSPPPPTSTLRPSALLIVFPFSFVLPACLHTLGLRQAPSPPLGPLLFPK